MDIVFGEAILGANIFKDIFGAVHNIIGGRSGANKQEMAKARRVEFQEMEQQAQ